MVLNKLYNWFKNKSIFYKVILSYIFSLLFIGIVGYSYYIYSGYCSIKKEMQLYRTQILNNQKLFISNIVNNTIKAIDSHYKNFKLGKISEKLAKESAINFVNNIRFKSNPEASYGYLWINTLEGIMVVDPPKPELNGIYVLDYKDPKGVYLFKEMANVVNVKGEGFVKYCWPKLNSNKKTCFDKISYVKYFPEWNWIVGSGFYLDEIEKIVDKHITMRKETIFRTIVNSLLFGMIATFIATLLFFAIIFFITHHLTKLGQVSIKLTEGEITPKLKLKYDSNDEIGSLVKNFNFFIEESYNLMTFKRVLEEDINIENIYTRISMLLKEKFNIDEFTIYEINNSKSSIKHIYSSSNTFYCKQDILTNCSLCRAARTAKYTDSKKHSHICSSFIHSEGKYHACIPMMAGGMVIAVIQLIFNEADYNSIKIEKIEKYLREASPVLESKRLLAQLKESTLKDPLTGLYNRRFLDESTEIFASSTLRRGTNMGILMCDIDFFKKVNDIYGHNIGDRLLKAVSERIRTSVRESDIVVRFGGEEFLVLLQDVGDSDNKVTTIAEKIRMNIENLEMNISGTVLKKTLSIGISIFPKDSKNFWQCIKFSDIALYKAKETGRNKVVRFEESMWEGEDY